MAKAQQVTFKASANSLYPTPPALRGAHGKIVERDGALIYVALDDAAARAYGSDRYWAFEAELEGKE